MMLEKSYVFANFMLPLPKSGICVTLASGASSAFTGSAGTTPMNPERAIEAVKKLVVTDFVACSTHVFSRSSDARSWVAALRSAGRWLVAAGTAFRKVGTWPPAKARPVGVIAAAAPAALTATTKTGRYMLLLAASPSCARLPDVGSDVEAVLRSVRGRGKGEAKGKHACSGSRQYKRTGMNTGTPAPPSRQ